MATPGAAAVPTLDQLERRRDAAIVWLRLSLGLAILSIPAGVFDIIATGDALNSGGTSDLLDLSDVIAGLLGIAQFVLLVGTAITFIRWMGMAVRVVQLTGGRVRHPGWVVWGWIVPVISLFRPVQIVNDLNAATEFPSHPATPPREIVNWWWGAWIARTLANFIAALGLRISGKITLEQQRTADYIDIIGQGATIAAALLAIRVVQGIDAGLTARLSAAVHTQPPMPPPPGVVPPPPPSAQPVAPPLPDGWTPPVAPAPAWPPPDPPRSSST
jgi:hypothetical protein